MGWTYLLIASAFEIVFALSLKYTEGFTRLWPSVITILTGVASVVVLAQAVKTLPIGTGYAAWTGIGAVGTVVLSMVLFNESRDLSRLISIVLIIAGIVGLRLTTPSV
jgi:quaternary ammonium compound-resistance protein SugE